MLSAPCCNPLQFRRADDPTLAAEKASLECGGRYYLPYRLEATVDEFNHAYPMSSHFFELKSKYDPDGLFSNEFYIRYAAGRN